MRLYLLLCSLVLPWTAHVRADGNVVPSVTVSADKLDQRRNDTVSAIVVNHDELIQQGDRTLSDALKRLPGITIGGPPGAGQGGQIQMRGLGNGYTLIMLNGVPVQPGFSLESLDPELVERIEIMRAATAEFSAQAIAGSINIVLKKSVARRERTVKLGASGSNDMPAGSATLQLSDKLNNMSYVLAGTLSHAGRRAAIDDGSRAYDASGIPASVRQTAIIERVTTDTIELAPRLQWALENEGSLAWQSLLNFRRLSSRRPSTETAYLGGNTAYPDSHSDFDQDSSTARSDVHWLRKLEQGASLDVKLGLSYIHRANDYLFDGAGSSASTVRHVDSGMDETGINFSGTTRHSLGAQHTLAAGWDGGFRRRTDFRREQQFVPGAATLYFNDAYAATVQRLALFAQDEWEISARWSLYLGLRWDALRTASATNDAGAVDVRSQVWSPVLQSLWKLSDKDQLRLALTRTYKAPQIFQLIPRPYTMDNANSPTNPDTQGNPALRPEVAWGLDAAYEYYPAKGAMLGASAALRRIEDVMMDRLYLSSLPQSAGRWIATPDNNGRAQVSSIELEAKLPLTLLWPAAPAIDMRANLARNWSRVDAIAGPDNRLDNQRPWSANAGLDYRLATLPLTLGGNFNYQAGARARASSQLLGWSGAKRELDMYALWSVSDKLRLRLSGANLLGQAYVERSLYADSAGSELRQVNTSTYRTVRLMLEGTL